MYRGSKVEGPILSDTFWEERQLEQRNTDRRKELEEHNPVEEGGTGQRYNTNRHKIRAWSTDHRTSVKTANAWTDVGRFPGCEG